MKEILEEMYDIQVRYTKPLLKENYTDKDYAIEKYENLVFKMKNIITNLQEENERLLVELNKNMIERNNYLSRNKKAIIYIQTEYESLTDDTHLLNILNGEDE